VPINGRKKKSELEPASKKDHTPTKQKNSFEKPSVEAKKTPVYKEYQSSSPSLKNIAFSAKNELNEPAPKKEEIIQQEVTNLFDEQKLLMVWNEFADGIENEFPRLFQVLKQHLPKKINESHLLVQFDNSSQQKDFMEKVHLKLIGYLKNSLNNTNINLEVEVMEELSNKQLVYTATDKYNYLADQNELLHKLKKNFNLDFE